jgi:hypothetical protein
MYLGGCCGEAFQSNDNGLTWQKNNNGINTGLRYSRITSLAAKGAIIFAGTEGSGVFRSKLNGFTSILYQHEHYNTPDNQLFFVPHPASDNIKMLFSSPASKTGSVLIVNDILGRQFLRKDGLIIVSGENEMEIDVQTLPNGVYVVRLLAGDYTLTKMLHVRR